MPPKKGKDDKKDADAAPEIVEESGVYVIPDHQAKYEGQVVRKDGVLQRNGQGAYQDPSIKYEGSWKDDVMHGEGVLSFADGSRYQGSLIDGQFDGKGTYTWANGSKYEGNWRFNRMHGEGTFTDSDGVLWSGKYYNGTGPGLRKAATLQ